MRKYTYKIEDDFGVRHTFIMITIGPSNQLYRSWSGKVKSRFHDLAFRGEWVGKEKVVKY